MAIFIFNLRHVPEDEADEVRQLLTEHHVDFYETPPGRWGISSPGLWLADDTRHEQVKTLIARYQDERARRARELYETQRAQGTQPTLWQSMLSHPVRFFGALVIIGFILYLSIHPFMKLIGM